MITDDNVSNRSKYCLYVYSPKRRCGIPTEEGHLFCDEHEEQFYGKAKREEKRKRQLANIRKDLVAPTNQTSTYDIHLLKLIIELLFYIAEKP
jgi:hypothetical protein